MIDIQTDLRPALPTVFGAKDYQEFRSTLEEMDRILVLSGAEHNLIMRLIANENKPLSPKAMRRKYKLYRSAIRYSILLTLTGYAHRVLAVRVADSDLFQWFTGSAQVDGVRPASKSTIERFEKMIPSDEITTFIHDLNRAMASEGAAEELLYREVALKMDQVFSDTACVETNIHFPVDWVLMRDATRTLMKAVIVIRKHGLKHRIRKPEFFMREMNKLCIEMSNIRKKPNAPKKRKVILRRMKKLMNVIQAHARNYQKQLDTRWAETDLSEAEARNIIDRIDNVLNQLPQAIKQAHERIIGERRVANKDKVLSFYEHDTRVIVRGKAGAEVEFGNTFYLAEQADGLIIDWEFLREQAPADNKLVKGSLGRIKKEYGSPASYATDRGFDAEDVRVHLENNDITNGICPRSVALLQERLEDESFCALQKRRAQTEGRVGIFKNVYLGKPLRSKGFANRRTRIDWCVLTHNLWKLARMAAQAKEEQLANAA